MGKIKMTYFENVRGRGEVMVLLAQAAKRTSDLEVTRVGFEAWPALKGKTPWGSLPFVEIDGRTYGQSLAAQTFVAKEFGLYPESNADQMMADSIGMAREDLLNAEGKFAFAAEDKKAELQKALSDCYDTLLPKFEDIVKNNPSKSGYAVGSKLSIADLVLFEATQGLSQFQPSTLEKYPCLTALRKKVACTPGLKEYLEKRPEVPI